MVRKFIRLGGVDVGSPLPPVAINELDRAFAGIPGLQMLIDPDYRVGNGIRNLAAPNDVLAPAAAPGMLTGAFGSGASAFQAADGNATQYIANKPFDPDQWTILAAHNLTARAAGAVHMVVSPTRSTAPTAPIMRVGFNGTGTLIGAWSDGLDSPGSAVVSVSRPTFVGRNAISMWTYSDGILRIFDNDVQVAEGAFPMPTSELGAGQWGVMRYMRGLIGNVAVLSSDLSRPEMQSFRNRAVAFMRQKYGL